MDWYMKTYEPSDAASIAQMWNESDEGWPGGFTGGVPFTAERVKQWLTEERFIDVYLIVADQRVVAYCSLYEYASEPSAAYVALLNCHPRYWKHGFGRELLKRSVARSTELGYKRLDLHTWPGNLRAVPLYKKTGFFWQPETQVHMLNFLPQILPLAVDFFEGDDWYPYYQRELAVHEDDIAWNGMRVYPYSFARNGRTLKAIIDRESRSLTALETDEYSVACLVPGHDLPAGMAAPVRWELVNKTAAPLQVSLLASGGNGLTLHKQATLDVRDRTVVEASLLVERDIVAPEKDDPAHKIRTTLVVNGRLIVLETGVRPKQAVEITADPVYVSLTPGLPQTVHFRLKNNLAQPVRASVALMAGAGLSVSPAQHTVDLPESGVGGVSCTMQAASSGAQAVNAVITAQAGAEAVAVRPVSLPVAAPGAGTPAAYLRQDEAVLENDWMRLVLRYRSAEANLYRKDGGQWLLFQRMALGPPFYPSELRSMRWRARLEETNGAVSAVLAADSRQYPGLTLERSYTMDCSSVVAVRHRLLNAGGAGYTLQIRMGNRNGFGERSLALPTAGGLVVDQAPRFPDWYDDEGRKPESLAESWLAAQGDGFVLGLAWHGATANEMDPWMRPELTLTVPPAPAYGQSEAPVVYVYAGPGDWRDVRRMWRRLVRPDAEAADPQPRRALHVATTPSPVVLLGRTAQARLRVDHQRSRTLSGELRIASPKDWSVTPVHVDLPAVKRAQPFEAPLTVIRARGKGPGVAEATVCARHGLCEEQSELPLVALGRRGGVRTEEHSENGQRMLTIDNGWMRLRVAPDYIGALVALEQGGVNHLYSSFPTPRPLNWINPWHGGVAPVLFTREDEDPGPGNPGRMTGEQWEHRMLPARRGAAIPWAGVRLSGTLARPAVRGLRLEMDYLTVGQSNVVAVVTRLVNLTAAPFSPIIVTQAYVAPGGDHAQGVLHYGDQRHVLRERDLYWEVSCGRWAGVSHGPSGQCVALAAGSADGHIVALDYGQEGAHLFNVATPTLAPHATAEIVSYLVLAADVAQARLYRCLEHLTW